MAGVHEVGVFRGWGWDSRDCSVWLCGSSVPDELTYIPTLRKSALSTRIPVPVLETASSGSSGEVERFTRERRIRDLGLPPFMTKKVLMCEGGTILLAVSRRARLDPQGRLFCRKVVVKI